MLPKVKCWLCVMKNSFFLNDNTYCVSSLVITKIPDYSICVLCYPTLLSMYSTPINKQSSGGKSFIDYYLKSRGCEPNTRVDNNTRVDQSENSYDTSNITVEEIASDPQICETIVLQKTCTFNYIKNWKQNGIFCIRIFIAMADWGITAYMLEHMSLKTLEDYCYIIMTTNITHWEFFQTLNTFPPDIKQFKTLAKKNVSNNNIMKESYDKDLFLNEEGLNELYQKPIYKKLTQQIIF